MSAGALYDELTQELARAVAADGTQGGTGAASSEGETAEPLKIVVVDDNEDGRFMLRSLCELDGHHVDEATDGPSGVIAALRLEPDLALVDIGLPGLDGYEVARRIRDGLGARAPYLVAVSGYSSTQHRQRAGDAGFDQLVVKPIEHEALRRVLASCAARPRRGP